MKGRSYVLSVQAKKYRKATGISSETKVPYNDGSKGHYLFCDFDGELPKVAEDFDFDIVYKTPHGYHALDFTVRSMRNTAQLMLLLGCDMKHVGLGLLRGYWFLETGNARGVVRKKNLKIHPNPKYMEIERSV